MATPRPPRLPQSTAGNKYLTAGAAAAFALCTFSYPIYLATSVQKQQNPLWTSDKPMGVAAVRRGAFMNSGSKDVGSDAGH